MKPISTLMKPLRSVDLTTMTGRTGGDRAQRRLRRAGRRRRRRSDGLRSCSPTRSSRSSAATPSTRSSAITRQRPSTWRAGSPLARSPRNIADSASPDAASHPPLRRRRSCTSLPQPVADITPEIQALIDDMIETMYAAPGIGLAAPQVGVRLRIFVARRLGRPQSRRPARVHQPGVRRARRHAARRRRLPERARLQRHRRAAVPRRRSRASIVTGPNR